MTPVVGYLTEDGYNNAHAVWCFCFQICFDFDLHRLQIPLPVTIVFLTYTYLVFFTDFYEAVDSKLVSQPRTYPLEPIAIRWSIGVRLFGLVTFYDGY
jgi:hypothetical protein